MSLGRKKISDLSSYGTMVLAQALVELEQSNLTAGTRSRKISLDDPRDAIAQTSLTDTTADRLMKVGAFGLGAALPTLISDLDSVAVDSFGYFNNTSVNQPEAAQWGVVITARLGSAAAAQIAFMTGSNRVYFRRESASVWQSWYRILTGFDYPSDTAWTSTTTLLNGWAGSVKYVKRIGYVTVFFSLDGTLKTANTVLTLPSGYRPNTTIVGSATGINGTPVPQAVQVATDGTCTWYGTDLTNSTIRATIPFPVL